MMFFNKILPNTQVLFEHIFPKEKISYYDYCIAAFVLILVYFFFFQGDIWVTGSNSISYLYCNWRDFYEYCNVHGVGTANYQPTTYVLFAVWLYPLKILGLITKASTSGISVAMVYWLKFLTTIFYFASGHIFYKIVKHYIKDNDKCIYATLIWLVSPIAIFSQFIFSQYDIFCVFFMMLGFLMFLRKKLYWASCIFGISMTFKYFPAFVFFPMLLYFEKRITKLLIYTISFFIPTGMILLAYSSSPMYNTHVIGFSAAQRIFDITFNVGSMGWQIYVLVVFFLLFCCWSYLIDINDKKHKNTLAYIWLVSSIIPFLFIVWHPQWLLFITPAIALTTVLSRNHERFLLFDLVGMIGFIGITTIFWQHNVDLAMLHTQMLGVNISNITTMGNLFSRVAPPHSFNIFMSIFWAYLLSQIIFKRSILKSSNYMLKINYSNIRQRFYCGLAIFILPLLTAIYLNPFYAAGTGYQADDHGGELTSERSFKQSFSVSSDTEIMNVEILLATFNRDNHGILNLELVDEDNEKLFISHHDIASIKDWNWLRFKTPLIKLISHKKYYIVINAPNSTNGDAITWFKSKKNTYTNGNAIIDGHDVDGDFSFYLY